MKKKTKVALSELDWFELSKTAAQLKEIAEYMMKDVDKYDAEKVELYAGFVMDDAEELNELSQQIDEILQYDED